MARHAAPPPTKNNSTVIGAVLGLVVVAVIFAVGLLG